jgi:hypothetical protein
VHAEHTTVDERSEREIVEDLTAPPPDVRRAVLPEALVVEAVNLRDLPALVVPPDERDTVRISDLQGEQEEESFYRVESAVDKVTCADISVGG